MKFSGLVARVLRPLASRKVRVALATVLAAYAAEYGLGWTEEMLLTVVSVGIALILGIAHEDAGQKQGVARLIQEQEGERGRLRDGEMER